MFFIFWHNHPTNEANAHRHCRIGKVVMKQSSIVVWGNMWG